jgi:hypothetical protein
VTGRVAGSAGFDAERARGLAAVVDLAVAADPEGGLSEVEAEAIKWLSENAFGIAVDLLAALAEIERLNERRIDWEQHEGMVTVYDWDGKYLGCMGIERWKDLLDEDAVRREPR